ncbi:MAG: PAS domain S-box-containing protein, partial [Natronomonas sp.]
MENSADSDGVEPLPPGLAGLDEPVFVVDGTGVVRNCNGRCQEMTGLGREELLGATAAALIVEEDGRFDSAVRRALDTGSAAVDVTFGDGEGEVLLECSLSALPESHGEAQTVLCIGHERELVLDSIHTERTRRQGAIETLQDATERIQQAETVEEVAKIAVEAITAVFDLPYAVCWFHNSEGKRLEPVYATDEAEQEGFVGSFSAGSYEYEIFREGAPTSYTPRAVSTENSLTNAILLPLGSYGMIGVGGTREAEFDESVVDLSRTLAKHTTIALERVDQTEELREERALTESIFV